MNFQIENANIIEFGSGRGQMTYWMAKSSKKDLNQKFILVDKASHRHKYDNKLKDDEELKISRIKADIQDLVIEKIPEIQASKVKLIFFYRILICVYFLTFLKSFLRGQL